MKTVIFLTLLTTIYMAQASGPSTLEVYSPKTLNSVITAVQKSKNEGKRPIVLFDLDDTLINTRERNLRILKAFSSRPEILSKYPKEASLLQSADLTHINYLMTDTLKSLGIINPHFEQALKAFWNSTFFTNEYCAKDVPTPGAVKYVNKLYEAGATIIYLTGRAVEDQQMGTEANLRLRGFPFGGEDTVLILKKDKAMSDMEFKGQVFTSIAKMDEVSASGIIKKADVVGAFENEPANINAMHRFFPTAISILLDTIHSPNAPTLDPGVVLIRDFYPPGPQKTYGEIISKMFSAFRALCINLLENI